LNRLVDREARQQAFANATAQTLPGLLGIDIVEAGDGASLVRLDIRPDHLAPNGYLHAGTIAALADTACGYGCFFSLPDGATNFATIELKTNFIGTARSGTITCRARRTHAGRTTEVWDAIVTDSNGKEIALFRCTQLLLAATTES
jgi:1,4-dihydroxy-2-naphthoyl-CoA hydrolase